MASVTKTTRFSNIDAESKEKKKGKKELKGKKRKERQTTERRKYCQITDTYNEVKEKVLRMPLTFKRANFLEFFSVVL